MDTTQFKRCQFLKVSHQNSKLFTQSGMISILRNKEYLTFLMTGETRNLSFWWFLFVRNLFYRNKRIYLWTHGWYGKETRIEAFIKKWMFRSVTGIFTYGDYAKKLLVKEGFSETKISPIHNALHYEQQLALRNNIQVSDIYQNHFGNSNPVLLFIGRLTKVKQLDMLVNAVADLKQQRKLYNLVFVGNGIERSKLEALVNDRGVNDSVWFYGECYEEGINAELIYNADLCVAPGNVGLTAMHSLMFGTPVITHDNFAYQMPEFEAIREGETGSFFHAGDSVSLATTISKWFSLYGKDRERVRQICMKEIDDNWTPQYQIAVLKKKIMK